MTGYSLDRSTTVDLEDLLQVVQSRKVKRAAERRTAVKKSILRHFPVTSLVTALLIIALGTMVTVLKAEITSLKSDLTDLKNLKAQVAALDPKLELASVRTKLERKLGESSREQERIKSDLAAIRTAVEGFKVPQRRRGR